MREALTENDDKVEHIRPALKKGPEPVGSHIENQFHDEDLQQDHSCRGAGESLSTTGLKTRFQKNEGLGGMQGLADRGEADVNAVE